MPAPHDERRDALVDDLKAFSERGTIVVEGKKDVAALDRHGIPAIEIVGSIYRFAEGLYRAEAAEVLILTDRDTEGEKLYAAIKEACARLGIQDDNRLRRKFFAITRLSHVEGF